MVTSVYTMLPRSLVVDKDTRYSTRLRMLSLLAVLLLLSMYTFGMMAGEPIRFYFDHFILRNGGGLASASCATPQYFGMNVDMSQLLPGSSHYVKNAKGQDLLDILAGLGANIVRLTNSKLGFPNNPTLTKAQWYSVLDKVQRLHMRAIVLIETPNVYAPLLNADYFTLLNTYINQYGLSNHPAVYAIDLKNEPYFSIDNLTLLAKARTVVKAHSPNMPVTIGGWRTSRVATAGQSPQTDLWMRPQDIPLANNIIDIVSTHLYGFDNFGKQITASADYTTAYIGELRLYTGKPIFIGEFGSGNGDAITDQLTLGSKQLQQNTYNGVFYAVKHTCNSNVIGATGYTSISSDATSQGWNIAGPNANNLFPAATAFRWQANAANITGSFVAMTGIPNTYLFTEQNNRATLTVHAGDNIAVILPAASAATTLSTGNGNVIVIKQNIKAEFGRFTAVLNAKSKGTVTLTVKHNTTTLYTFIVLVK